MNAPHTDRELVVNADDLGFVPSVTRGIIEAMEHGIVRSASLMANMPNAADAVRDVARLRSRGLDLGVGLHFNIVVGEPVAGRSSLAGTAFHPLRVHAWRAWRRQLDLRDVERELRAQLERASRLLREAGMPVTHIDSHRHAHCLPGVYELVVAVAREHGIPHVRQPAESAATLLGKPHALLAVGALRALVGNRPHHDEARFAGVALMRSPHFDRDLGAFLEAILPGTTELMVHPGYDSPELAALDPYRAPRERELRALTAPSARERVERLGIRLARFGATARAGSAPTPAAPATPSAGRARTRRAE